MTISKLEYLKIDISVNSDDKLFGFEQETKENFPSAILMKLLHFINGVRILRV